MMIITLLLVSIVLYMIMDYLWIGVIMKGFYTTSLSQLGRLENGSFKPRIFSMILVYISLGFLTVFYLIPRITGFNKESLIFAFLFGFVLYAFYEYTNYAIIKDWPKKIILLDCVWGGILVALVSCLTFIISAKIFF